MKFIDMHCDSLMMLLFRDKENTDLYDSKVTSVDFKRMKEGDQLAQFFAVFLPPHEAYKMFGAEDMPDEEYIATLRKYFLDNVAKHEDIIKMAYNADDIERNLSQGLISAVLTMEDGSDFDGIMGNLEISDCSKVQLLADSLKAEGFNMDEIEKIFHKNVLCAIKESMK